MPKMQEKGIVFDLMSAQKSRKTRKRIFRFSEQTSFQRAFFAL